MVAPNLRARSALTDRLRQARIDAGFTGSELAAKLGQGWGQPKVSKLENGRRLPSQAEIQAWAAATDTDPRELTALLDRARHEYSTYRATFAEHGGADGLQDAYAAAEQSARVISSYQPLIIPGFLQTADYARDILNLPGGPTDSGATHDEISRMVAARMRRSAILYEPGRDITILMGEAALRTQLTSPPVMREQLEHVARLAETLSEPTIGIVPFDQPAPVLAYHGWDITDDIVTIETPLGDLDIADPAEVDRYRNYTALLLDSSLRGVKAAALCRRIASGPAN